jgi:hypothetical protein
VVQTLQRYSTVLGVSQSNIKGAGLGVFTKELIGKGVTISYYVGIKSRADSGDYLLVTPKGGIDPETILSLRLMLPTPIKIQNVGRYINDFRQTDKGIFKPKTYRTDEEARSQNVEFGTRVLGPFVQKTGPPLSAVPIRTTRRVQPGEELLIYYGAQF